MQTQKISIAVVSQRILSAFLLLLGLTVGTAHAVTFDFIGPVSVIEGAGTFDFTLRLSATQAETTNGSCDVDLDFFTEAAAPSGVASATSGEDYVEFSQSFNLTLPANANGDVSVEENFSITIIDDDQVEPLAEGFTLFGEVLTGACFGQEVDGVLEDLAILDDEALIFTFSAPISIPEDSTPLNVDLVLVNPAAGPTGFAATLQVDSQNGTAEAGSDFVAVSELLDFDDLATTATINVEILDDLDSENDESFSLGASVLSVTDQDGFELNATVTNSFQATIVDNDAPLAPLVTIGFDQTEVRVLENSGTVVLAVVPDVAPLDAVTVDFVSIAGSADEPADYEPSSGTLTFPAGTVEPQTISIQVANDVEVESQETFSVQLSNPQGANLATGAETALVIIEDNDTDAGSNVVLTGAPGETLNFTFSVSDDSAARNTQQTFSDVSVSGNGPFTVSYEATIPPTAVAGQTFSDAVEFQIDLPPSIDVFLEINVVAASATEYAFDVTSLNVAEDAGSVQLAVRRLGDSSLSGSVEFQTVAGTAQSDVDFAATSDTVAFAPGETGPVIVSLDILDDALDEDDETFSVQLSNPLDGTVSATAGVASVVIQDDEQPPSGSPGTLQFTATGITVNESAGTVEVEVSREGGSLGAVSVFYSTVEDTALEGADFAPSTGTLSWADGEVDPMLITVDIVADTQVEGLEEFTVVLSDPSGATIGTPAAISVVITDLGRDIAGIPGLSGNQRSMASWFDENCERLIASNPASLDQQDLASVCTNLRSLDTTDQQVRDGLDAVNAEELATAATTTLRLLGDQHGNLQRRINGLRSGATGIDLAGLDITISGQRVTGVMLEEMLHGLTWGAVGEESDFGRWGFFVDGKIDFGERDNNAANSGYDLDSTLVTVGADYRVRDNFFVGGALGYADADVDFNGGGGLDFDNWRGSLYATYFASDRYYIDGLFSYGTTDYDSARRILYTDSGGTVDRTATGSTDGKLLTTGFGSGFDFNKGGFTFGPNFGAYYVDVDVDSYSESGAGGLNLNIGDQNAKSLTVNAGGHASWVINTSWGVLIPNARFDLVHEFEDGVEQVGVRFAADPFTNDPNATSNPIMVSSERPDQNYFVWSVGASAQFVRGFSGFVSYQSTEGYSNLELNEISFGMRYEKTF